MTCRAPFCVGSCVYCTPPWSGWTRAQLWERVVLAEEKLAGVQRDADRLGREAHHARQVQHRDDLYALRDRAAVRVPLDLADPANPDLCNPGCCCKPCVLRRAGDGTAAQTEADRETSQDFRRDEDSREAPRR